MKALLVLVCLALTAIALRYAVSRGFPWKDEACDCEVCRRYPARR